MLDQIRAVATCITIPIYTMLLIVLVKQRTAHFQSAFYIFYISTGIADIVNCFVRIGFDYVPTFIINTESYVESSWPFATISFALYYFIQYVQILGIIIISANRLTAIAIPFKHMAIWSQRNTIVVLVVQWMLPSFWIYPTFHPCCQCEFINGTILAVMKNEVVRNITYVVDGISGALVAPVSIITTNVLIMIYMRRSNRAKRNTLDYDQKTKNEIRLAIVSCVLSATYTAAASAQVLVWLMILGVLPYADSMVDFSYHWFLNFFDLFTISNPYLLLFLSTAARKEFFAFLGIKRSVVKPSFITLTNHRQRSSVLHN